MFSILKRLSNIRALLRVTYLWKIPPPSRNTSMDVAEGGFCTPLMRSGCTENVDRACQHLTDSLLVEEGHR